MSDLQNSHSHPSSLERPFIPRPQRKNYKDTVMNASQKFGSSSQKKPSSWLKTQGWMNHPDLKLVMSILSHPNIDTRLVGGCVRDAVLKRKIKDIDIATPLLPQEVMRRLEQKNIKVIPTGIDHGTVTAVMGHHKFEITTLRKDVATDGRRATIEYTQDWLEDAKRRDFTFNALSCNLAGEIYDPFGGIADLNNGQISFIGQAEDRIKEDYLRILRFFRFFANYGFPPMDKKALKACVQLKDGLKMISKERIRDEFLKTLSAPDPYPTLKIMNEKGILSDILPNLSEVELLERMIAFENELADVKPLRRLFILAKNPLQIASDLVLSNPVAKKIEFLAKSYPDDILSNKALIRELLYYTDIDTTRDILFIKACQLQESQGKLTDALIQTRLFEKHAFPVTGHDLKEIGLKEGPSLGLLLKQVEKWWIANDFSPSKEDCLGRLQELSKGK